MRTLLLLATLLPSALLFEACSPSAELAVEPNPPAAPVASARWSYLQPFSSRYGSSRSWDGRVDGMTTLFHSNGVRESEGRMHDGKREGPWAFWYPDGTLRWQGTFEAGRSRGFERGWYSNGIPSHEGIQDGENREGLCRAWHDNGQLREEGTYLAGKPHGELRVYERDGSLDRGRSGFYRHGKKIKDLVAEVN